MITGTLSRYFGLRFVSAVLAMFAGTLVLTAMIDFLELMRRSGDIPDTSAWLVAKITLFRVPLLQDFTSDIALENEVRQTVLHELAHHLGIDDDRLGQLGIE